MLWQNFSTTFSILTRKSITFPRQAKTAEVTRACLLPSPAIRALTKNRLHVGRNGRMVAVLHQSVLSATIMPPIQNNYFWNENNRNPREKAKTVGSSTHVNAKYRLDRSEDQGCIIYSLYFFDKIFCIFCSEILKSQSLLVNEKLTGGFQDLIYPFTSYLQKACELQ